MKIRDSANRFGLVTIANHWLTALIMIGMVILGLYMADLPKGPEKGDLIGLHKSFGVLVLMLGVLRLSWRLLNPMPNPVGDDVPWLRRIARLIHKVLMALILLLPLSGWLMSSAGAHPVSFFGLFTLPPLIAENKSLGELAQELHEFLAWTLVTLFVLHAGAALKHHFIARDSTLRRMLGAAGDE